MRRSRAWGSSRCLGLSVRAERRRELSTMTEPGLPAHPRLRLAVINVIAVALTGVFNDLLSPYGLRIAVPSLYVVPAVALLPVSARLAMTLAVGCLIDVWSPSGFGVTALVLAGGAVVLHRWQRALSRASSGQLVGLALLLNPLLILVSYALQGDALALAAGWRFLAAEAVASSLVLTVVAGPTFAAARLGEAVADAPTGPRR